MCYVFVYLSLFLLYFFAFIDPRFEELGTLTDLKLLFLLPFCCFHYNIFIVIYIILIMIIYIRWRPIIIITYKQYIHILRICMYIYILLMRM